MASQVRKKRAFTRTTTGCLTCRRRHIKCDEVYQPERENVSRLGPGLNCRRTERDCIQRPRAKDITYSVVHGEQSLSSVLDGPDVFRHDANDKSIAPESSSKKLQIHDAYTDARPPCTQQESSADREIPAEFATQSDVQQVKNLRSIDEGRTIFDCESPHRSQKIALSDHVGENAIGKERDEQSCWDHQQLSENSFLADMFEDNVLQTFHGCVNHYNWQLDMTTPKERFQEQFLSNKVLNGQFLELDPLDPEKFLCMHHYVTELGTWDDIWDDQKRFTRLLPQEALRCPPLLAA